MGLCYVDPNSPSGGGEEHHPRTFVSKMPKESADKARIAGMYMRRRKLSRKLSSRNSRIVMSVPRFPTSQSQKAMSLMLGFLVGSTILSQPLSLL